MLWKSKRRAAAKHSRLTAFIDEGSAIEGKYTFSGTVVLEGKFQGEIVTTDVLVVGEKAMINATIRAGSVTIRGEVIGHVEASERVELKGRARVFGDLETPIVSIEEGVLFEGQCRMTKSRPGEPARSQPAEPARSQPVVPFKR